MNELKSECAIFNKFLNEMVSNLYMFSPRVLNMIFRDVNGTGIVAIDGKMFLTNTIFKEFLHPQKLGATATGSDVFSLNSGYGYGILLFIHLGDKIITHIKETPRCTFSIISIPSPVHIRIPS